MTVCCGGGADAFESRAVVAALHPELVLRRDRLLLRALQIAGLLRPLTHHLHRIHNALG